MTTIPRLVCVAANPSVDRLVEVDRLRVGAIHRPDLVVAVAGGKGLNVARAAKTLGAEVTAVAILAGHSGRWIRAELAASGIDGHFTRGPGETRVSTSVADRATGALTEFYEPGPTIEPSTWRAFERLVGRSVAAAPDVIMLSGSLPVGVPVDGYGRLCRIAARRGVRAIVDASGAPLAAALAAEPWVVKLNADEATDLFGRPVNDERDAIAAVRAVVERGARSAIVTLGVNGAVAWLGGQLWRTEPPLVRGSYPVGSGDAFLAGLAVGLATAQPAPNTLALASAAAAANARVPGAAILDLGVLADRG